MKTQSIIAGAILLALNGAALVPSLGMASYAPAASLAIGIWLLLRALMTQDAPVAEEPASSPEPAPLPVSVPENRAEAEIVTLMGAFQEKGRLVDFLMDDIAAYSDAQVGGAARVVHQGCQAVLKDHFSVVPVAEEQEGSQVSVPQDASGSYRLSGKIEGSGPFVGKLVHKGWKTGSVKLPRILKSDTKELPVIAPAQVEVR